MSNKFTNNSLGTKTQMDSIVLELDKIQEVSGYITVVDVSRLLNMNYNQDDNFYGWENTDDIYSFALPSGLWSINFPDPVALMFEDGLDGPCKPDMGMVGYFDGYPVFRSCCKKNEARMSSDRFKELLNELDGNSLETLKEKSERYSQNGDVLHNFHSGAEIIGGTPAQACWGYLTKHLVALRDKVNNNDFSNREDFLEKCQDTINYIRFLWCIGNEEVLEETKEEESEKPRISITVYRRFNDSVLETFLPKDNPDIFVFDHVFQISFIKDWNYHYKVYPFANYYYEIKEEKESK